MDYSNEDTTKRAKQSSLWQDLEDQRGKSLPYLLERYLLLENWRHLDKFDKEYTEHFGGREVESVDYDINYLHLLLADAVTVLLNQEERIRNLEGAMIYSANATSSQSVAGDYTTTNDNARRDGVRSSPSSGSTFCECANWCRINQPLTDEHHINCKHYKPEPNEDCDPLRNS